MKDPKSIVPKSSEKNEAPKSPNDITNTYKDVYKGSEQDSASRSHTDATNNDPKGDNS